MEQINNHKKRKFESTKIYRFHQFCREDFPHDFTGVFGENIKDFSDKCAERDADIEGFPAWFTLLVVDDGDDSYNGVTLYTIEESVEESKSPFCYQCLFSGWSHHFVSRRRYHLIIPVADEFPDIRLFDQTHLLHGLIHCNGFGHLMNINGFEGGSKFLSGQQIMDLWDRICTALRVRKITVEDVSHRGSMDLRLLYGIADGHSWFGRWGYTFCPGSFNGTEKAYNTAIEMLSSWNLDDIVQVSGNYEYMKKIIEAYRELSKTQLITTRDLFAFMLGNCKAFSKPHCVVEAITKSVQQRLPLKDVTNKHSNSSKISRSRLKNTKKPCSSSKFISFAHMPTNTWPARRLDYAAEVIVNALKAKGSVMSRLELRDAAREFIGDTGLLDFVLSSSDNLIFGENFVCRTRNPVTNQFEFTLCKCRKYSSFAAEEATGNWSAKRLEYAVKVIVAALKARKSGMNRKELKEEAKAGVGDTGLLDFVLKSINGMIFGNFVVRRTKNPVTNLLEFNIHELYGEESKSTSASPATSISHLSTTASTTTATTATTAHTAHAIPGSDVYNDLLYLYKEVFLQGSESIHGLTLAVLDSKHFVKEWTLSDVEFFCLRYVCWLHPSLFAYGRTYELSRSLPPPSELVVVPKCTETGELKEKIQSTYRDTYCVFDSFNVTEVQRKEGMEGLDEIWVLGDGLGEGSDHLKYEGRNDSWIFDCICGAKDAGEERMAACLLCHVRKHARCCGINDDVAVPKVFFCPGCRCNVC
ncbi:hypothetical protein MKW98_020583 [Papaver atlanticum]|uniref:Zinc finger PHD-type domain-containing protein n=1 Tax=Papaver atlanticum TaxID=357466 RepID=A0AAD4T4G9_9MAGN|nr:hypothetical protein MKW98_020583 [Papaver atlanticum]